MSRVTKEPSGSSSEANPRYDSIDEKKRKRMISNRESARRSRMNKQNQLGSLISEISNLQNQNAQLRQRIDLTSQNFLEMESANNVLRARAMELADRLRSVNSVLEIVDTAGSFDIEIPEVQELLHEPWMQSGVAPLIASADNTLY